RLFIVEKTGDIKILDLSSGQVLATPFLDLTGQINTAGERGLLGLAFDPNFASNGFFYIDVSNPSCDTEIRRYHVNSSTPNLAATTRNERLRSWLIARAPRRSLRSRNRPSPTTRPAGSASGPTAISTSRSATAAAAAIRCTPDRTSTSSRARSCASTSTARAIP